MEVAGPYSGEGRASAMERELQALREEVDRYNARIAVSQLAAAALRRREETLTGVPYGVFRSRFVRRVTPTPEVKLEETDRGATAEEEDQLMDD